MHNENKCAANHFTFSNCPSASELLKCDYTAEQSWCETTFESVSDPNPALMIHNSLRTRNVRANMRAVAPVQAAKLRV